MTLLPPFWPCVLAASSWGNPSNLSISSSGGARGGSVKNAAYDALGAAPQHQPYDAFGNSSQDEPYDAFGKSSRPNASAGSKRGTSGSVRNDVYAVATSPSGTQYYTADNVPAGDTHYATAGNAPAAYATAGNESPPEYATAGNPSASATYYSTAGNVPSPVYVTTSHPQYDTAGNLLVQQHSAVEYDTPSSMASSKKETLRRGAGAHRNDVYSAGPGSASPSHYSTASNVSHGGAAPEYATAPVSTSLTRAEAQYAVASQPGGSATYAVATPGGGGASSTDTYALAGRGGHDSDEDGC